MEPVSGPESFRQELSESEIMVNNGSIIKNALDDLILKAVFIEY